LCYTKTNMNAALKKLSDEMKVKLVEALATAPALKAMQEIKAASDTGTFKIIISSEHRDRQGETVLQDGINTDEYMRNPVVLNSHDYHGIENIIGLTTSITKEIIEGVKVTIAEGKWAPTEGGQAARKLWEGGFLNAGSIGFIAMTFASSDSSIITSSELLEWSAVAVPANSRAVRINSIGLTEEWLRSKGFTFEKEADPKSEPPEVPPAEPVAEPEPEPVKAAGDTCTMDDGVEGVMTDDGNGAMVCKPKEPEKAVEPEKKDAQRIGAVLMELQNIIDNALVGASRIILDIVATYGQSREGKAEIAEIAKGADTKFQAIKTQIADLQKCLGVSEGEERQPDGGAPQQRSEGPDAGDSKELNDFLLVRQLLKSVATATSDALEHLNEKARTHTR